MQENNEQKERGTLSVLEDITSVVMSLEQTKSDKPQAKRERVAKSNLMFLSPQRLSTLSLQHGDLLMLVGANRFDI